MAHVILTGFFNIFITSNFITLQLRPLLSKFQDRPRSLGISRKLIKQSFMEVPATILNEIVETLDIGFKCFFNLKTHEIISFPDTDRFFGEDLSAWEEDTIKVEQNRKDFLEIENVTSSQSFRIMSDFVDSIDEPWLKATLQQSLEGHKPFANFKHQIDNAGPFRNHWFSFKKTQMSEWVLKQIE